MKKYDPHGRIVGGIGLSLESDLERAWDDALARHVWLSILKAAKDKATYGRYNEARPFSTCVHNGKLYLMNHV